MPTYKGADPTVILVNQMEDLRGSLKYDLFYQGREMKIDNIIESSAIKVQLDTQYEKHYRRSYCIPHSRMRSLNLKESSSKESIKPKRPNEGEFRETTKEYPRGATAQEDACDFCSSSGQKNCPNCERETEVTCPDCNSPRSGDCSRCSGKGEVKCSSCGGDGNCSTCGGSREVDCSTCRGSRDCKRCSGSGRVNDGERCSKCSGSGRCQSCGGRGKQDCTTCGATGDCKKCNGRGRVECPKCGGTGRCQTCGGKGTKTCPTCDGRGRVNCPVCESDGEVLLYTSDVYEYEPVTDTDEAFPESFDRERVNLESIEEVRLQELDEENFRQRVGLLNEYISNEIEKSRKLHRQLNKKADQREEDRGHKTKDKRVQNKVFSAAKKSIRDKWKKTDSDSYHAEYSTSCTRSRDHNVAYKKILFQKSTFEAYPVSMVKFRIEDDQREMYAAGTKEDYDVSVPLADRSIPKIGLFSGSVLSAGAAAYVYSTGMSIQAGGVALEPLLGTAAAGGLAILLGGGFAYLAYQTRQSTDPSLVTVVGEEDSLNTTLLSVLADTVSYEEEGTVRDKVYRKISEKNREGLTLGSSLSYSIEFDDGEVVRIVSLSTASYESMDEETQELLEKSEGVIGVAGDGELPKRIEEISEDFDGNVSIVCGNPDAANGEYETYEMPIEDLQEKYLEGEQDKYKKTIECVRNTMREDSTENESEDED